MKTPVLMELACSWGRSNKDQGLLGEKPPLVNEGGTSLSLPIGLGMSLADELLADLEEAAEEEEGGSYGEEEEEPAIEDVQEETQLDLSGDSVKSIAKLWDSKMVSGL